MFGLVGLCRGLSPSQCTKGQFFPSTNCVRIADLMHPCFQIQRTIENTFKNLGQFNSAQNKTKNLPKLMIYLNKPKESLLYRNHEYKMGDKV